MGKMATVSKIAIVMCIKMSTSHCLVFLVNLSLLLLRNVWWVIHGLLTISSTYHGIWLSCLHKLTTSCECAKIILHHWILTSHLAHHLLHILWNLLWHDSLTRLHSLLQLLLHKHDIMLSKRLLVCTRVDVHAGNQTTTISGRRVIIHF